MLNPDSELHPLLQTHRKDGVVHWIGIRPRAKSDMQSVESVIARQNLGLEGDHYSLKGGKRQVTLIQAEHLAAVASILGYPAVDPLLTRRNIVVMGINLTALKNRRFRVGDAVLEYAGECHPCSRMEENLGSGGYNAMRGHGGILARVIQDGTITLGDAVAPITIKEQYDIQ